MFPQEIQANVHTPKKTKPNDRKYRILTRIV